MTRVFARYGIPLEGVTLYGEPIEFSQLATALKAKRETFLITSYGYELDLSSIRHYRLSSLSIKAERYGQIRWDEWVSELINEHFVSAWVADVEYEYWQNAADPLQYTTQGRPWEHLPKKSNGLPPPVEQIVVDTSQNPGRRVLRVGFIEAVGSVIWVSERFWEITRAEKQRVISTPFLKCAELLRVCFELNRPESAF